MVEVSWSRMMFEGFLGSQGEETNSKHGAEVWHTPSIQIHTKLQDWLHHSKTKESVGNRLRNSLSLLSCCTHLPSVSPPGYILCMFPYNRKRRSSCWQIRKPASHPQKPSSVAMWKGHQSIHDAKLFHSCFISYKYKFLGH